MEEVEEASLSRMFCARWNLRNVTTRWLLHGYYGYYMVTMVTMVTMVAIIAKNRTELAMEDSYGNKTVFQGKMCTNSITMITLILPSWDYQVSKKWERIRELRIYHDMIRLKTGKYCTSRAPPSPPIPLLRQPPPPMPIISSTVLRLFLGYI